MSGRFSRNKGRREEQQLVIYLSGRGYTAERILRQYQAAGQPDVKGVKDGKTVTFEMKSRRNSFKTIYDFYYSQRDTTGFLGVQNKDCMVAVSSDVERLESLGINELFIKAEKWAEMYPKHYKATLRLIKLKEMKQEADFLVIRDNNKPRLFLRYWG